MEKRRFTRVPFKTLARLHTPVGDATGEATNLSLKGMRLLADRPLPLGAVGELEITLEGADPEVRLTVLGTVVRSEDHELGVEFELQGIDVEALTHLRAIVSYNTGESDQVLREFVEYLEHRDSSPKA